MRMSQVPTLLESAHKAGLSVFLKSAPGIGKTSAVRQYAEAKKLRLIHIHAPLTDPLDIKGLPTVANDEAKFLPLNIWPKESDAPVVVLIDEIAQCAPMIMNAYSQLLIDHQIGGVKLPKNSFVVATGNRREDRAATNNVPSHVVNRIMHVTVDTNAEDFLEWGLKNGINPMIIAFGRWRPTCLHTFDPQNSQDPYASSRTWEMASNLLNAIKDDAILYESLGGLVGEGPASEFLAFKRLYLDLPDPKQVLINPDLVTIPQDPATMYALVTAVATIIDENTADNFMKFTKRLPVEYGVLAVRTGHAVCPAFKKTKAYKEWALSNIDVII